MPPPRTVLCVDDSVGHLRLLELALGAYHYRVETATDGHEALTKLQSLTPDLLILDVEMPFMDGFELASRVRRLRRFDGVPILLMTAMERSDLQARADAAGIDAVARKPMQGKNLSRLIGDLIREGPKTTDRKRTVN